jgi:hypothetical protein
MTWQPRLREMVKMIGHLEDLVEIWETLDTCYERPEKYVAEALKPIIEFRRYKVYDNTAVREFSSLLRGRYQGGQSSGSHWSSHK